jgi:hypothetical protein
LAYFAFTYRHFEHSVERIGPKSEDLAIASSRRKKHFYVAICKPNEGFLKKTRAEGRKCTHEDPLNGP